MLWRGACDREWLNYVNQWASKEPQDSGEFEALVNTLISIHWDPLWAEVPGNPYLDSSNTFMLFEVIEFVVLCHMQKKTDTGSKEGNKYWNRGGGQVWSPVRSWSHLVRGDETQSQVEKSYFPLRFPITDFKYFLRRSAQGRVVLAAALWLLLSNTWLVERTEFIQR